MYVAINFILKCGTIIGVALNSLVGDRNDVTTDECVAPKRKRNPRNKKATLRALDRRRLLDRDSDEF